MCEMQGIWYIGDMIWLAAWHGMVGKVDGMAWFVVWMAWHGGFYGMYVAWHGIDRVVVRVFAYGRVAWHGRCLLRRTNRIGE